MEKLNKMVMVWTSGDKEVAQKMVFMYTYNCKIKGWWQDVTLVVWGPSARLLADDRELQDSLRKMKNAGIELLACKVCTDMYGVTADLEEMGIEVKHMGDPLTRYLKEGISVLTV